MMLTRSLLVLPLVVLLPACSTLHDRFGQPVKSSQTASPDPAITSAWASNPVPKMDNVPASGHALRPCVARRDGVLRRLPAVPVPPVHQSQNPLLASVRPQSGMSALAVDVAFREHAGSLDNPPWAWPPYQQQVSYDAVATEPPVATSLTAAGLTGDILDATRQLEPPQGLRDGAADSPIASKPESSFSVVHDESGNESTRTLPDESPCPACHQAECQCVHQVHSLQPGWPPVPDTAGFCPLETYIGRASEYQSPRPVAVAGVPAISRELPKKYVPWWHNAVVSGQGMGAKAYAVNSEKLVISALRNAQFIKALADLPLIRETNVIEAGAEFDVRGFMESKFLRPSDPVGNELTTGPDGPSRFREQNWNYSLGVRKKVTTGGEFELSQQVGLLDNNSEFLDPKSQGNAKFRLSFSQPLLNGAGQAYNTSLIVLAEIDERAAWDKLSAQLQDYLLDVIRAYWELYLQRAVLQQKIRHFQRAQEILSELEDRRELDAAQSQIARARAAVTSRRSEIIRAETAVRNAESRIRALVNAPDLVDSGQIEIIPTEVPARELIAVSPRDALVSALENRPEIDEAIQQIRSAGVRLDVSENELKPVLDVVLETYVSGLRGSSDIGRALGDQFTVGEPSYSAGILFEMPLHNRAARARNVRRKLEMRQLLSQFQSTVEGLMSDVEIAVREVQTTYHEMQSRYQAMVANEIDLNSLTERWRLLPGDDRSASFVLEDILDAQDRLVAEELEFVSAQVGYTLSLARLNRALGVLLQTEQVDAYRSACQCGLPQLLLDKPEPEANVVEEIPLNRLPVPEPVPARNSETP